MSISIENPATGFAVSKLLNLAKSATVNGRKLFCFLRWKFADRRGFAKKSNFATETPSKISRDVTFRRETHTYTWPSELDTGSIC